MKSFALHRYTRYKVITNFRRCRFQRDFFKTIWCYPVTQVRRWGATDRDVTWKAALLLGVTSAVFTGLIVLIIWLICCKCRRRYRWYDTCSTSSCCCFRWCCCCRRDEYGYDDDKCCDINVDLP